MEVRSVSVCYGETRSANYQGRRIDVGLTADLDHDEDADEARDRLMERCKAAVKATFAQGDK